MKNNQISNIYRKILYKNSLAPVNIGFTSSNSWYDATLTSIPNALLTFIPINYDINNIINYNLYLINNPINFSLNIQSNQLSNHINKILFFHEESVAHIKKEDLFLLNENLKNYTKYIFSDKLSNSVLGAKYISYGFPQMDDHNFSLREKSILFVGDDSNINQIIFNSLKQVYKDMDFIKNGDNAIDIENRLLKYRICINLDHSYNTLLAASKGCITISSDNNKEIPHHYSISNTKDIFGTIESINKNYTQSFHIDNYKFMTSKYSYDTYIDNIKKIIDTNIEIENFYE